LALVACSLLLAVGVCGGCANAHRSPEGFWADYDPSSILESVDSSEQMFLEWAELLLEADKESRSRATEEFVEVMVADPVGYHLWTEWVNHYLYGLWSPVRNEEAFEELLDRVWEDERVPAQNKEYIPRLKGLLGHNSVGTRAEDIEIYDAEGNGARLSDLRGRRVVLVVVDTTCPSCVDTMQSIEQNEVLMGAAQRGELALVAVAINQTPEGIVELTGEKSPLGWSIYCASSGEFERSFYDSEASPMIFLLSHEGVVEVAMTRNLESIESAIGK
jgi:hypothetical protein